MDPQGATYGHEFGYYSHLKRTKKDIPDNLSPFRFEFFFGIGQDAADTVSYTTEFESEELEWMFGTPVKLRFMVLNGTKTFTSASLPELADEESIPTIPVLFELNRPNPLKITPLKYARAIAVIGEKTGAISVFINAIPTHRNFNNTFTTNRKFPIYFNCTFQLRGDKSQRHFFLPKLKKCSLSIRHNDLQIAKDPAPPKRKMDEPPSDDPILKKFAHLNPHEYTNFLHPLFAQRLQTDLNISL